MPLSITAWGDPLALSETDSDALRDPVADGVKVTDIVQLPFTAKLLPQLLVALKSPELAPVMLMLLIVNVWLPEFASVTVFAVLVVLTA